MCAKPAILHKVDKSLRKYSAPGYTMHSLSRLEDLAWEERRRNPAPVPVCDGCSRRFRGVPVEEGFGYEDGDEDDGDAGDRFKRCTECDYTICEDCTHPEGQGQFFIYSYAPRLMLDLIY